jgi:hypothetical protein
LYANSPVSETLLSQCFRVALEKPTIHGFSEKWHKFRRYMPEMRSFFHVSEAVIATFQVPAESVTRKNHPPHGKP